MITQSPTAGHDREQGHDGHDHGRHGPGHDHHLDVTRSALLADWYREHGRHDLAWRQARDRWPVLVSEVMLQQTQVPRVADAWPGFIGALPDPERDGGRRAGRGDHGVGPARLPAPGPPPLGGRDR